MNINTFSFLVLSLTSENGISNGMLTVVTAGEFLEQQKIIERNNLEILNILFGRYNIL